MSIAAINMRLANIEDMMLIQLIAAERMVERAESLSLLGEIAGKLAAIESSLTGLMKKRELVGDSQANGERLRKQAQSAENTRQAEEKAEEKATGKRKGRSRGKSGRDGSPDLGDIAGAASAIINAAELIQKFQQDNATANAQENAVNQATREQEMATSAERAAEQAAVEQSSTAEAAAQQAATEQAAAESGQAAAPVAEAASAGGQEPFNMEEFMTSAQEVSDLYAGFMKENEGIANQITTYLPVIDSMFNGLNAGIAAYNKWQELQKIATTLVTFAMQLQQLAALGLRGAWTALTTAIKANPMVFIVTVLLAVGSALMHLWKTNDTFALNFLKVWHNILGFFDQVAIFFWTLAEALLQPFVEWAKTVGNIYDGVINGIIGGLNSVLGIINQVAGTDYKIDFEFSMEKFAEDMLANVQDKKQEAIRRSESNRAKWDLKESTFLEDRAAARAAEALKAEETALAAEEKEPRMPTVSNSSVPLQVGGGRLDEVGRVNDTVDISSEDLKTMRELAEMKNIQNFVTLTPSVNVQTGDIRNGMDVSSMVQAITAVLQDEIASSAEGVYA